MLLELAEIVIFHNYRIRILPFIFGILMKWNFITKKLDFNKKLQFLFLFENVKISSNLELCPIETTGCYYFLYGLLEYSSVDYLLIILSLLKKITQYITKKFVISSLCHTTIQHFFTFYHSITNQFWYIYKKYVWLHSALPILIFNRLMQSNYNGVEMVMNFLPIFGDSHGMSNNRDTFDTWPILG